MAGKTSNAQGSSGRLGELVDMLRDPYERKARVFPGLLVVLPTLVPIAATWGTKHPVITGVLGLVVSCGVVFALSSLVRDLGKAKQEKLVQEWGGLPTTWMLRHRDKTLESGIKGAYHQLITQKLGLQMPSAEDERQSPAAADDAYGTAAHTLRGLTRGKEYAFLLKENISYGFRRNMYGARKLGLATSVAGLVIGVVLSGAVSPEPLAFHWTRFFDLPVAAALTMGVSLGMFVAWLYFGADAVRRMGIAYAERLFEALGSLPNPRAPRETKQEGSSAG